MADVRVTSINKQLRMNESLSWPLTSGNGRERK
jgi:hypothetical protein